MGFLLVGILLSVTHFASLKEHDLVIFVLLARQDDLDFVDAASPHNDSLHRLWDKLG